MIGLLGDLVWGAIIVYLAWKVGWWLIRRHMESTVKRMGRGE